MTNEEKARAYDEALEDMRVIYPNLKGDAKLAVEHAFPELTESEDERARKFLVKHVSEWIGCIEHDLKLSSKDVESEEELAMFKACLAYLERLKEYEITEEDKKIIPEALVMLCDDIINHRVHTPIKTDEEGARKIKAFLKTFNRQPHKTRRDWEKQKEQKPAEWSEEDERMLERAIHIIAEYSDIDEKESGIVQNWLNKSLKPQSHSEWRHYIWAINMRFDYTALIKYDNTDNYEIVQAGNRPKQEKNGVYILIKDIKPQSHWKPSEEQMEALMLAIEGKCPPTSYMSRRLEDLYEALANEFHVECKLD